MGEEKKKIEQKDQCDEGAEEKQKENEESKTENTEEKNDSKSEAKGEESNVEKNLLSADRKSCVRKFPAKSFKRIAHVVMGEPNKTHKDVVKKKILAAKQAKLDADHDAKLREKQRKRILALKEKELAERRRQADEAKKALLEKKKAEAEEEKRKAEEQE